MSEVDQIFVPQPGTQEPPSPAGLIRNASAYLLGQLRNKEHRGPAYFTISSVGLSIAGLFSTIAITHYISPHDLGLWASVGLAMTYASFVLVGVQNGLSRELPYYLGAESVSVARQLAATALFYTLSGCGLTVIGGGAVVGYLAWRHADPKLIYSVAAITILIAVKFYQNYLFTTFRSKNAFLDLARVQFWQMFVTFLALPLLLLGYGGLLFRAIIIAVLALYWMHRVQPMAVRPSWNFDSFKLLFRTGITIFATDYVASSASTFDKVVLLKYASVESLGYYTLALSAYSAFQIVPQSIAHYIYPRMSHHLGRTNSPRVIWGIAWKINLVVIGCMLPLAICGWFLMPTAVRLLFPKYISGTHPAQIALLSAVACGACTGVNALLSMKAWAHLITYQMLYALLLVVSPFVGVKLFASPLTGVAYGVLIANCAAAILGLVITFMATHRREAPAAA